MYDKGNNQDMSRIENIINDAVERRPQILWSRKCFNNSRVLEQAYDEMLNINNYIIAPSVLFHVSLVNDNIHIYTG